MHIYGFMCLCILKLPTKCQILILIRDWCQISFWYNFPYLIPKYWTAKKLSTQRFYIFCFIFWWLWWWGVKARQDYFTQFEPSQSLRRKREISRINHLATRKQNLACPTCDPSYAWTHIGEMTSDLECLKWLVALTTRARGLLNFVLPIL